MSEARRVVLDSSAVLALLFDEPGGSMVVPLIPVATISAVNMSEVLGRLARAGVPYEAAQASFEHLDLDVAAFGKQEAAVSSRIAFSSGGAGLSLGDRACIATAETLGLPAVTADRQWADLHLGIEVRLIRG